MRFLANENMPAVLVGALRGLGFDISWIREEAPGALDPAILAQAVRESRVLLTFDKDFGELAYLARLPSECGVVLFRLSPPRTSETAARIAAIIATRDDWAGRFAVIEPGRLRMRDLPNPNG